jgi:hypothetical protein
LIFVKQLLTDYKKYSKITHVINPLTKEQINVDSELYNNLVRNGVITRKDFEKDFVINPYNGRVIKIGSKKYKELVKQGII